MGEVAARFGAARGALQALQQAAATFAGETDSKFLRSQKYMYCMVVTLIVYVNE